MAAVVVVVSDGYHDDLCGVFSHPDELAGELQRWLQLDYQDTPLARFGYACTLEITCCAPLQAGYWRQYHQRALRLVDFVDERVHLVDASFLMAEAAFDHHAFADPPSLEGWVCGTARCADAYIFGVWRAHHAPPEVPRVDVLTINELAVVPRGRGPQINRSDIVVRQVAIVRDTAEQLFERRRHVYDLLVQANDDDARRAIDAINAAGVAD